MTDDEQHKKAMRLAQWLLENSPYYFEQAYDDAISQLNNPDFEYDKVIKD